MYTTMFLMIFARLASLSGALAEPPWADDYYCAHEDCAAEQKPMVAFIGKGELGRQKLALSSKSRQLIRDHYVCVYIDANGEDNKLARVLNIKQGVVISTEGGRHVAFRHDGKLASAELERQLARFSGEEAAAPAPRPAPRSC